MRLCEGRGGALQDDRATPVLTGASGQQATGRAGPQHQREQRNTGLVAACPLGDPQGPHSGPQASRARGSQTSAQPCHSPSANRVPSRSPSHQAGQKDPGKAGTTQCRQMEDRRKLQQTGVHHEGSDTHPLVESALRVRRGHLENHLLSDPSLSQSAQTPCPQGTSGGGGLSLQLTWGSGGLPMRGKCRGVNVRLN